MIKNKIKTIKYNYFRRIYFTFLSFFLVVGCLGVVGLQYKMRSSIIAGELVSIQEKLVLLSPQAKEVFESEDYSESQELFPEKSRLSNTRYTLIAPRGEVVGDSHHIPETIVRGWEFPEVKQALTHEWGMDTRRLDIHGERVLIVALALRERGEVIGVIRGELPLSTIDEMVIDAQQALLWTALVGALIAFIVGFLMTKAHAEPISQMAEVCKAIQLGDYSQKVEMIPANEIGQLAITINNLSRNVLSKISSLSLERAQLKSMLACMKEGILSLSDDGDIQFCNLAAYHHLDLSPEGDIRGLNIESIEGLDPVAAVWKTAAHNKELMVEELTYRREPSTEAKHLKVYATFYESVLESKQLKGKSGVMIVIDNHTEIKQLQNIRKDFFAHVSHELKTPLTSIAGYVETLTSEDTLKDLEISRRFLAKISANTERLLALVMDLLSLSSIESRSTHVEKKTEQWLPIIRNVAASHGLQLEKKNIRLEVKKQYGGLLVLGEKDAMHTICENLLSNAIRYSKEGSTISMQFSKTKSHLFLHVMDAGVGIDQQHLPKIFDRFYRVDKARSRREGGTGLGLSIVKMLVARIGGSVSVESQLGEGSTFTVGLERVF